MGNDGSYQFGSFRLEASEYVLLRDGQAIPLTPKVFETLLVLVENSGHIVDKRGRSLHRPDASPKPRILKTKNVSYNIHVDLPDTVVVSGR